MALSPSGRGYFLLKKSTRRGGNWWPLFVPAGEFFVRMTDSEHRRLVERVSGNH